jgi:hypothetical protein
VADTTVGESEESSQRAHTRGLGDMNPWVAALIALAITSLFAYAIVVAIHASDTAPIPADPSAGTDGYDAFARIIQVIGLVTPVLTTILGFYFGVRAGAGGREAAETRAVQAEDSARVATGSAARVRQALTAMDAALAGSDQAEEIRREVRETYPDAFDLQSWLGSVRDISPPTGR